MAIRNSIMHIYKSVLTIMDIYNPVMDNYQ